MFFFLINLINKTKPSFRMPKTLLLPPLTLIFYLEKVNYFAFGAGLYSEIKSNLLFAPNKLKTLP